MDMTMSSFDADFLLQNSDFLNGPTVNSATKRLDNVDAVAAAEYDVSMLSDYFLQDDLTLDPSVLLLDNLTKPEMPAPAPPMPPATMPMQMPAQAAPQPQFTLAQMLGQPALLTSMPAPATANERMQLMMDFGMQPAANIEGLDVIPDLSFNLPMTDSPASDSSASASASGSHSPAPTLMSDAIELKNPSDRKAKRRQQVAISARRHRCRKKHEMINLKKEVSHLTSQLELLRSRHKMMRKSGAIAEWEETAMAHRRKRRQAEQESEALRRAIFLQSGFLQELKSAFSSAPIFNMEMNLRELLHTYIHLGKNARTRMRDYETICSESKLDMALEIVRRETKHIKFDRPFMASNPLKLMGQFGTNHVSVYSFEGVDLSRVFFAACKAVQEHGFAWPDYCSANIKQQTLEEPSSNIQYSKATVFYKNCKIQDEEAIVVESRSLYYYRFTESYGIMVWDFVDQDDLHPLSPETQIRRDMVGSLFVSREMCDDGVQRVVCRCVCTKLHEQNKNNPAIERFSTSADSAECGCGKAVYDKVKQNIVGNEEVPAM